MRDPEPEPPRWAAPKVLKHSRNCERINTDYFNLLVLGAVSHTVTNKTDAPYKWSAIFVKDAII